MVPKYVVKSQYNQSNKSYFGIQCTLKKSEKSYEIHKVI